MLTMWWDNPADGPTNMAADECLAAEAEQRGCLLLRVYGWTETTVSLGAFQKIEDARRIPEIDGVPLVRRPSGGGAILHGSDLTYAAAVPKSHPWGASPQTLYDALHGGMVAVLSRHGIQAWPYADSAPAGTVPPGHDDQPFFCFDRRAAGDLLMAGPGSGPASKIMGSAQRRLAGAVLQHGSLLLRGNTLVGGAARHVAVSDLLAEVRLPEAQGLDAEGLDAEGLDAEGLAREWGRRIAATLGATVGEEDSPFCRGREQEVAALASRFRELRWTLRR